MTAAAELPKYDFRQPSRLADDMEHLLKSWQNAVIPLVTERWTQQLGCDVLWQVQSLNAARSSDLAQELPEEVVCSEIELGEPPAATWVILPRRLALALVIQMLGEPLQEFPEDRPLTDVEAALMEHAVQEFAEALLDGQPMSQPLRCRYVGRRRVSDLTRAFSPREPLAAARFQLSGSYGQEQLLWLLSQSAALQFVTRAGESGVADRSSSHMEELVRRIPVQVVVRLGRANMHVSELVNLQPGDVLVLDQRVHEPLCAEVAGATTFRGWPGRVGPRQAFQIKGWVKPEERADS